MASRHAWLAGALAAAILTGSAAPAQETGQEAAREVVTLRAEDGSSQVTGELVGFDGTTYTLRTALGTITVEAAQVTCEGAGCPAEGAAPDPPAPDEPARVAVAGSNLIGEGLMPVLVEGYADTLEARVVRQVGAAANRLALNLVDAEDTELAAIELDARGTRRGAEALAAGEAAIALASQRLEIGEEPVPAEHILALDGLVLLVHPSNPVRALSLDQIAAVFAGRIESWGQLDGPDLPISLYLPPTDSGTTESFEALVMRPRNLELAATAERLDDHATLSDLVSIDPGGIGVTGSAFVRAAETLAIRQPCGLVAHPDRFAIKAEEYPLTRRLYAYTAPGPLPRHAEGLMEFALSDAAQPLIAEAGFVDRALESRRLEDLGARLVHSLTSPEEFDFQLFREMLLELKEARRLSVTFRFERGATELESRSQAEAERLARRLADGDFAGKEVLLLGFADSVGEFAVNRDLARRRADTVLAALLAAVPEGALDQAAIRVESYGELTPVGCNETPEGRQLNRRVEVWLRDAG